MIKDQQMLTVVDMPHKLDRKLAIQRIAIRFVKEMIKDFSSKYLYLEQFSNLSNPKSHYLTTAPEIKKQLSGKKIDAFVAGIGTGGTLIRRQ